MLYVGVSNYSGAQFAEATRVVQRLGLTPITIHQPYYNMLGRRVEWGPVAADTSRRHRGDPLQPTGERPAER